MKLNGTYVKLDAPQSLKELLVKQGYNIAAVAVECNGAIIPKSEYESTFVDDSSVIEVVKFVGGG